VGAWDLERKRQKTSENHDTVWKDMMKNSQIVQKRSWREKSFASNMLCCAQAQFPTQHLDRKPCQSCGFLCMGSDHVDTTCAGAAHFCQGTGTIKKTMVVVAE